MSDAHQPTVSHTHDDDKADETEPDVHFEPVVKLEKVEIKDSEADETPIFRMRAKLFRFDKSATEWKERGTGEMKLLMHKSTGKVRVLMRRDKTLKLCANHYITPEMKLNPNVGSDRSWVWTALADYSEEEVKPEMLAARFANSDIAQRFKAKFEEAQKWNQDLVSGAATPNSNDAPKPDPDALEVQPEEGSDKKKKDDTVAATVTATVAAIVASDAIEVQPKESSDKKESDDTTAATVTVIAEAVTATAVPEAVHVQPEAGTETKENHDSAAASVTVTPDSVTATAAPDAVEVQHEHGADKKENNESVTPDAVTATPDAVTATTDAVAALSVDASEAI